jgi:hypothetical protein
MNQNLEELFNEALEQCNEPAEFWGVYIEFIEKNMIEYFKQLKNQGMDKALLTAVSRSDLEETTKERLEQIKHSMMALSNLNKVFNEKEQRVTELDVQIRIHQGKTEHLENELHDRHSEFQDYKQKMEKKIQVQENQINKKLNDNTVMVRQSVNNINEYMQQASTLSEIEFNQLHSKVQDAVSIIVDTLSEQQLWPTTESKPILITIDQEPVLIKKSKEKIKQEKAQKKVHEEEKLEEIERGKIQQEEMQQEEIQQDEKQQLDMFTSFENQVNTSKEE